MLKTSKFWITLLSVLILLGLTVDAQIYLINHPQPMGVYLGGGMFGFDDGSIGQATSGPTAQLIPSVSAGTWDITGKPTISAGFINQELCTYHSPTCGMGADLYNAGVKYGIDPVFGLAIFWNESNFGTTGEARVTSSLGNTRCLDLKTFGNLGTKCVDVSGGACPSSGGNCYAWFPSWQNGFLAAFRLLAGPLYVGAGLRTLTQVLFKWAPWGDHNNPPHYVNVVESCVLLWRAGSITVPK